jgi:FKBP-type peptidyl-prolyl cis-trans isomerase FkpA
MDSNRFRPTVTTLESREVPSVSPTEIFDAVAQASQAQEQLDALREKGVGNMNVYTVAYLRTYLPSLSTQSVASADKLAEYQNLLEIQAVTDPSVNPLLEQVAYNRYKAEVNALWGNKLTTDAGGTPVNIVRTPIAPDQTIPETVIAPPPVVVPPVVPPTTSFDKTTSAGMTDTIPDVNSTNFVAKGDKGLKIWDVQVGEGDAAKASQDVKVFYTGWLLNGTQFETNRTSTPTTFNLDGVISGFNDGIQGMKPGGIRRLSIPSALGYGTAGSGSSIPPNSDLVFEVKLLSATDKAATSTTS